MSLQTHVIMYVVSNSEDLASAWKSLCRNVSMVEEE